MDVDTMFFNDYCIVCDRAIVPPKEPEPVAVAAKKKVAAGAIRIRNPDGTVTTRTANGQKTTRPPLRRGPNSANRLAAVAAAHGAPKPLPLTRSKTAEPAPAPSQQAEGETTASSPDSLPKTPACPTADIPFHSPIYCSRACAQVEADRSSDLARKMSVESGLHLITSGLPISGSRKSPYGPPSPLFISDSETSASSDPAAHVDQAATSAPNFFHMHRDTEEAWRDINRQRRSSVHPGFRPGQIAMTHRSQSTSSFSAADQSSDSLNSLWIQGMDQESSMGRSTSGSGKIRMTPVTENIPLPQRGWPTASVATSLSTHSSAMPIPAEFGSAPEHTLNLWHSYHNAFSHRDATGTSASRGFSSTPTPPQQASALPSRRGSHTLQGASLQRPIGGTIRAKSKTDVTWDSFGLDEVNAHKKRHERTSGVSGMVEGSARTPKQSIQIGERGCIINHYSPPQLERRGSVQSTHQHPGALAIPQIDRVGSSISSGRTPTNMGPPQSRYSSSSANIPDLASLRIGAGCMPHVSAEHAVSSSQSSAPRSTWNWSKWEKEGGRTYAVPEALTKGSAGAGKSGLFFFK